MIEAVDRLWIQVTHFYARQSRLIDDGDAAEWAATFTPDGRFISPSYPQPVRGAAALESFARDFAVSASHTGVVNRHVVTNVEVLEVAEDERVVIHAYLQIIATDPNGQSRLVRLTRLVDQLVRIDGSWSVAHREVLRDGRTDTINRTEDLS